MPLSRERAMEIAASVVSKFEWPEETAADRRRSIIADTILTVDREAMEDLNEAIRILSGVVETAEESHAEHGPGCYINEARDWLAARKETT